MKSSPQPLYDHSSTQRSSIATHPQNAGARAEPELERMIARIVPSKAERSTDKLDGETIDRAARSFRADGALMIEDIVHADLIAEARKAFHESYSGYLDGSKREDTLGVGGRRVLITVRLEPPFDKREFFANPFLLEILRAALDDGFVLGAFGVVCSLPGAPAQQTHDDGGILFPQSALSGLLPPVAVTVAIPLIEMNEAHGTTTLWLGSHRDAKRLHTDQAVEPVVREGSCMIWDFRLKHAGTPNRSAVPRPLLYLTYCRPWYFEHINFNVKTNPRQKPLIAKKSFLSSLSDDQRRLLIRAQEE
jgi:ectoine hydroxylase-related dioxygenase (phytanoyl-CoA dioxygenase family)